ncbi:hypothetical protein BT96DRAFT_991331 [Gymnopus androsaceus JB14]|uniref:Uncharacterized protein n=1 Tax=Gymnopus androsaceus JB14 TaxID=1447944 RepID=A0A6A4HXB5_9AGAR|nr:hypothetical protein BT96DRAFT_991331 [Gymnopus androsaceus JB14]
MSTPPPPKPKAPKKKQKLANPFSYVPPTEACNHFLPIIHDSWPIHLHVWDIASVRLKELEQFTGLSQLEQFLPDPAQSPKASRTCYSAPDAVTVIPAPLRGVFKLRLITCFSHTPRSGDGFGSLDPALFVTPDNTLKVSLLMMWLRICPALLWRLGLPNVKLFINKQWRAMLEAADGFLLEDSCSVGIQIDADNIVSVPALWNGIKVNLNASGQIDANIVRQVIWELYEIKFCLEMLMLDRYMVLEPQGDTDEVEMLKEAWYEREFQVHVFVI